jgi:RNA polymerase sigma-70 factor (ECF subfamily)
MLALVSFAASALAFGMDEVAQDRAPARAEVPSLEEVFRAHHAFVFRCVRRLGLSAGAAEDVTQDVFLVVRRRLPAYEERGSIRSWLYRIAQRVVSTHKRGESRSQRRLAQVEHAADESTVEDELARRQAAEAVGAFLDRLDENQRMVFVLADIEGMKAADIAEAVGVGVNTVYSRLRLARQKFNRFAAERGTES